MVCKLEPAANYHCDFVHWQVCVANAQNTKGHNAVFFFGNNIVHFLDVRNAMDYTFVCNGLHFCKERNGLHLKKKGHMASRHLLGLGKSYALIGWGLLDELTVGQTN